MNDKNGRVKGRGRPCVSMMVDLRYIETIRKQQPSDRGKSSVTARAD